MGTRVCYRCAVEQRRDTKLTGDVAEVAVIAALIPAGYRISIPFGENHRYDLVADRDGQLMRIQVKTGRLRRGAIGFKAYSSHAHRGGGSCRPYVGEVDAFGVYCAARLEVYLIPIVDLGGMLQPYLRVDRPVNGQVKKIRWAGQYLVRPYETGRDLSDARSTEDTQQALVAQW